MTATTTAEQAAPSRLQNFPITFFATSMGFGGLTLALRAAAEPLGLGTAPFRAALAATVTVFGLVALVYAVKAARYWRAVHAEWHHPVRLAFFPTVSVSILLMSIAFLSVSRQAAELLWLFGTGLQGVLTLAVITGWIGTRSFMHGHLNPAWFIPAVGNVIVPVAGAQLGYSETSWLFFSAGIMFWVILLTLVFNRLVFHDPMPGRLQPTLVIMIAPPSVAFIAWVRMQGETAGIDAFGHILLSLGYVFAALVLVQLPRILKLPFAMSFWALSFPLAALTIASFVYAEKAASQVHMWVGAGLLAALALLIAVLVGRTAVAIARHEICHPE
ncbi:C4-dicarboxylate ABC transporter [Rhodobacter veldkampii DSM 11550]|uniref:C4-dicarboxylate ABC transporter n=1 Tax=Phaeovulum veldkampii DSM 11550 TaxID=1185920 RepID=A0A2T4JM37_9RHOB|nr:SLAC1 anion channel family protein [Phaeovulum veldkampii]MBK5945934.1 C4-dicarboxylate ABC transporter [Phaeovulum veldkampii DSM 11550]NCU20356.1 C4-dicarboxylate ABC transporter [Candidatus Falkowbacteria bacterium]PTE18942.1 C4-dicarboxylate ABC transporter [Phaeovulum veldkampii DSM 11550]TDQ64671.1 tellurite resistance protein [Phaeovulum veldkampii DSM 11550]